MRLIDAEKLKNQMIAIARMNGYGPQKVDALWELINAFCELIDEQPTAFDADKVISELKRDKFVESECILSDVHQGYNAGLNRAIEIVKGGGVE